MNNILKKKEGDYMDEKRRPIPAIKREIWLLLKEYCLRQTRETGRQVTIRETVEEAILNLVGSDLSKKK